MLNWTRTKQKMKFTKRKKNWSPSRNDFALSLFLAFSRTFCISKPLSQLVWVCMLSHLLLSTTHNVCICVCVCDRPLPNYFHSTARSCLSMFHLYFNICQLARYYLNSIDIGLVVLSSSFDWISNTPVQPLLLPSINLDQRQLTD